MTATPSIPNYSDLDYFSLTFAKSDSFRLIQAPKNIIEITERALLPLRRPQKIFISPGLVEYKLSGNPILFEGAQNIDFKYLLSTMINENFQLLFNYYLE